MNTMYYLGDGVTVQFTEAGDIMLSTPRETGEHFIFLDFEMVDQLKIFADRIKQDIKEQRDD